MADNVKVTNDDLEGFLRGLGVLGNRRMANHKADLKVGRLLRLLKPYAEPIAAARRNIALEVVGDRETKELTALDRSLIQVQIDKRIAEMLVETVEVPIPLEFALKSDDFPKEQSGDEGWKNASQIGAIAADLGILYIWPET